MGVKVYHSLSFEFIASTSIALGASGAICTVKSRLEGLIRHLGFYAIRRKLLQQGFFVSVIPDLKLKSNVYIAGLPRKRSVMQHV